MDFLTGVFAYHERTKHHFHRYARSLGYLDWANQPQPFRYYHGATETRLELNREAVPLAYHRIYEPSALPPAAAALGAVADFFRYSLALTAWKQAGTSRWALRANPSSGNLHPTEAYVLFESRVSNENSPTLYHYVSETHSLERRATFSQDVWKSLMHGLPDGSFLLGMSSVIWREAWKYGERAFRYCQHDLGHAVAALRFSAVLCGWQLKIVSTWSAEDLAALLGLNRHEEFLPGEGEEPELLAVVIPNTFDATVAVEFAAPTRETLAEIGSAQWYGRANRLSVVVVGWASLRSARAYTSLARQSGG